MNKQEFLSVPVFAAALGVIFLGISFLVSSGYGDNQTLLILPLVVGVAFYIFSIISLTER